MPEKKDRKTEESPTIQSNLEFENMLSSYDTRFDEAYNRATEHLKGTNDPHSFSIDQIPLKVRDERMKQLELKLAEYTGRIRARWDKMTNKAFSKDIADISLDTRYKRDFLRLALTGDTVDLKAIGIAYKEIDGSVATGQFINAYGVISDYIQTGGADVRH